MTIFDYLNDLLKDKTGKLSLEQYSPYLINKWLSFINPQLAEFINRFNNKLYLEDKEMHYKTMLSVLPKIKSVPRIDYIKKIKTNALESDKRVAIIASGMEISKREAAELLNYSATNA